MALTPPNSHGAAGSVASPSVVVGPAAAGAALSGAPVRIAGVYKTASPAYSNGQVADMLQGAAGEVAVAIVTGASNPGGLQGVTATTGGDTRSDGLGQLVIASYGFTYNGTSRDRLRGNVELTLLASAARTATTNSPDQTNYNGSGLLVVLNATANPGGAETLSLKLQAKDSISAAYIDIADAGVVLTAANGIKALAVYPAVLAADFVAGMTGKSAVVPRTIRAVVTHSGAGSWTYSVSAVLLV